MIFYELEESRRKVNTCLAFVSETCEYTERVCACAPRCQPLTSSTYAKLTLSLSVGMLPQETRKRQIAHPLFLVWSQRSPRSPGMPTLPAKSCLCDWNFLPKASPEVSKYLRILGMSTLPAKSCWCHWFVLNLLSPMYSITLLTAKVAFNRIHATTHVLDGFRRTPRAAGQHHTFKTQHKPL